MMRSRGREQNIIRTTFCVFLSIIILWTMQDVTYSVLSLDDEEQGGENKT
jgi:hypothetical protein